MRWSCARLPRPSAIDVSSTATKPIPATAGSSPIFWAKLSRPRRPRTVLTGDAEPADAGDERRRRPHVADRARMGLHVLDDAAVAGQLDRRHRAAREQLRPPPRLHLRGRLLEHHLAEALAHRRAV